jgi:hypothetical protein
MIREYSELKSGSGGSHEIVKKLVDAVQNRSGNDAHVRRILSEEGLAGRIAALLVRLTIDPELYLVRVKGAAQLIEEGGYVIADDLNISKFRDPTESGVRSALLVQPTGSLGIDDFLRELERFAFRPATLQELLAFGIQNATDMDNREISVFTMKVKTGMEGKIPGVSYSEKGLRVFGKHAHEALSARNHFLVFPEEK